MKIAQNLVLFGLFMVLLLACKKKPMAGLGGNATLIIQCQHHSFNIDSATTYIKYNSLEAVPLGEYNNSKVLSKNNNNLYTAQFDGLKPGDYYLFAQGWDPSIANNVKGGIPFTIKEEDTFSLIIPVTEVH
jgi:hypothetical protein